MLKAKKQECERWKKANDEKNELLAKMGCPTAATAKRKVFTLQQQIDTLKEENDLYKNAHKTEQDRRRSYENAFAEIKEIIKQGVRIHDDIIVNKQILQKISEVENEN